MDYSILPTSESQRGNYQYSIMLTEKGTECGFTYKHEYVLHPVVQRQTENKL